MTRYRDGDASEQNTRSQWRNENAAKRWSYDHPETSPDRVHNERSRREAENAEDVPYNRDGLTGMLDRLFG